MELLIWLSSRVDEPSDMLFFFGRLHPLVVHLPIGILLLAIIAHFATRYPRFQAAKPYVTYLWGLGALSALLAVLFGYVLSLTGNYNDEVLFRHKWSGVAVGILAVGCYVSSRKSTKKLHISSNILVLLLTITLFISGHQGGNLTHGSSYLLEYAPNPIRSLAGLPPKKEKRKKVSVIDSADIFLDIVLPVMDSRCVSCHNSDKKEGDLVLSSYSNLMQGGDRGEVVIAGNAEESELYNRITLPESHEDFMPAEGKRPLTDLEVALVEWWINSGAPSSAYVTAMDPGKSILAKVESYLGLDKNKLINTKVTPPDQLTLDSLRNQGFVVRTLMRDNHFLDANFSLSERNLEERDLDLLLKIKEQLIWLDLSNSGVTDTQLQKLGQLKHLVKLDLSGNTISDMELEYLTTLSNLELLNLYNTRVSEKVLEVVPKMKALKTVYLWQTLVSDTLVERLAQENPHLKVISKREQ
ncbi:MAG: c-type cytochrome domain-containing protein [Flavobacteriaceae bacterium]